MRTPYRQFLVIAFVLVAPTVLPAQTNVNSPAMRENVYSLLVDAQACAEGGDLPCARRILESVGEMTDLDSYETAQLSNFSGFLDYLEGNFSAAIGDYENVLQQDKLPEGLEQTTMYTLTQLYFREGQHQASLDMLNRWFDVAEDPAPEAYVLKAQIHYQLNQLSEGIDPVRTAIELSAERGLQPEENWYRLLNVFHQRREDYGQAIDTLETMIRTWPERGYYLQLSAMNGLVGDKRRQLELYEIAHAMGWLTASNELVQLAHLLLAGGKPEKASEILRSGLETGAIERSERNLGLLQDASHLADDSESARYQRTGYVLEPIRQVGPVYPALAASVGLEGYVIVELSIDDEGAVQNVSLIESSHSIFEEPAIDAARRFEYVPRAIEDHAAEPRKVRQRLTFALEVDA